MSFGIVQSMIISMKNNSRKKVLSHFDRKDMPLKGLKGDFNELLKRKATPEQLENIRKEIKRENKIDLIKTIIIMIIAILILIVGVKYLIL
ncbi:hypothetical protein SAMN05444411_1431 [Lutibacter oricola]|uniref:Uncharacterized protein n=1 Tax=Lutibacter oricola TaxID=762486 RepID=A0A1H3GS26_9FLAO|nr:hypothetical protein [Lutibacter oricola]SDY06081.1 hypothetical protein SAMN05444411_1174 [Lutibacter oricola]SDY15624.1 hypothetical protein SAMN05444411_1431 [Lutibacter oricola]